MQAKILWFKPRVRNNVEREMVKCIRLLRCVLVLATAGIGPQRADAQCATEALNAAQSIDCMRTNQHPNHVALLEGSHAYTLAELTNIAEISNPATAIYWERATQKAKELGIAESDYFPVLAAAATAGDLRFINPFPEALLPRGYSTVEVPFVTPEVSLQYLILDFGGRRGKIDQARAEQLAAGAQFVRENQLVAFEVAESFYQLATAEEGLEAAQQTLKTAEVTQEAAEAQLAYGRSTLPDVLNARAEAAQASFDLQSAIGDETIAHIRLSEAIGAEPSPDIQIELLKDEALPKELTLSIDELIDRAVHSRPDLQSQVAEIRAAYAATREAKSALLPTLSISGTAGQTSEWPTADNGKLGAASVSTWSASLNLRWTILDRGARKNRVQAEESREREAQARLRELHDETVREVWSSYISFMTAVKKENSAVVLLAAANESYSASLDAYKFGVKNLIDVVTAERQLAQARLSSVAARSELLTEAVNIEFVTGSLLRASPPLTTPTSAGEKHK